MRKSLKWLTCTPKRFVGDETFFARDSGLLSEGFRAIGCDTESIMLGPARDDDDLRCNRATIEELEDYRYWQSQDADGVVLYAWGMPRYTPIARAINKSGLKLVVHMDTGGLLSPRVEGIVNTRILFCRHWQEKGYFLGSGIAVASWLRGMIPSLRDLPRIEHLEYAHVVGTVSPIAVGRIKNFLNYYDRDDIAQRVHLIEHPISHHMVYSGEKKQKLICAVGRWSKTDAVKRPKLLVDCLRSVLGKFPDYSAAIIGHYDHDFKELVDKLPEEITKRIKLYGQLSSKETGEVFCRSRVSLCTSLSESFHIASAEALCCGCSVVSCNSPYLPSFDYFVTKSSGTLADNETSRSLSRALIRELNCWENNKRNPEALSCYWTSRLHAANVAKMVLNSFR